MMGTEKLRGVLYHLPQGHRGLQHANVPNYAGTFGADSQMPSRKIATVQSSGRKRIKRKKDPNAPRSNRSSYNFFFGEQHLKLKALHPERERELGRMIGDAWNRLTEEEKIVSIWFLCILLYLVHASWVLPNIITELSWIFKKCNRNSGYKYLYNQFYRLSVQSLLYEWHS